MLLSFPPFLPREMMRLGTRIADVCASLIFSARQWPFWREKNLLFLLTGMRILAIMKVLLPGRDVNNAYSRFSFGVSILFMSFHSCVRNAKDNGQTAMIVSRL